MAKGDMAADRRLCAVTQPGALAYASDGLPLLDAAGQPVFLAGLPCLDCLLGTAPLPAPPSLAPVPLVATDLGATPPTGTTPDRHLRSAGWARAPPARA